MSHYQALLNSVGAQHIDLIEQYAAHNYAPVPIVIARAKGVWNLP